MYIGRLKGVGKLWQYTTVDRASSFAVAAVRAAEKSAPAGAAFLRQVHRCSPKPASACSGRAIVDGGPEFQAEFRAKAAELGVVRHQSPARSPNLNAFVERFQGTALHAHYRIAFRYRYYTSAGELDADLQAWLRYYTFERPPRPPHPRPAARRDLLHRASRSAHRERMESR